MKVADKIEFSVMGKSGRTEEFKVAISGEGTSTLVSQTLEEVVEEVRKACSKLAMKLEKENSPLFAGQSKEVDTVEPEVVDVEHKLLALPAAPAKKKGSKGKGKKKE